jgi:hypothetical protein
VVISDTISAIWDNRSAFHTATFDYEGLGERLGNRAVGIGEKPYLDTNSKSRTEELLAKVAGKLDARDGNETNGISKKETVSA